MQAGIYRLAGCVGFALFVSAVSAFAAEQVASKDKGAPPPEKWESRVTDVFFPDVRVVLVGPRPDYKKAAASKGVAGGDGNAANAGGTFAWSKIISADTLQDEIKALGPQLAEEVKTQQSFIGGGNKKARQTLSVLAATFAVIGEYDGDVKWKKQGPGARDLFARAGYNCKAATENTFKEAKLRSDDIGSLVRGESITVPASAEPKTDWGKVANLSPLMTRLEMAEQNRIAPAASNAGEFKKNATQLRHEAEMVAALAEAISRPGMENADDEKFRQYAKSLQQAALELRKAIDDSNYDAARSAAGTMKKACANCHGDFR